MATEKRLIDAGKLRKALVEHYQKMVEIENSQQWGLAESIHILDVMPTVDAVEVVRCKECVCYEETCPGYGYCYHWDYEQGMSPNQVESDDFCSYGERRTYGTESDA